VLLTVFLFVVVYCLAALALNTPPWKASLAYKHPVRKKSSGVFSGMVKWLARYIPINNFREAEIQRALSAAGMKETPKEYVAAAVVPSAATLLIAVPAYFVNPLLAAIPAAFAVYLYIHKYNSANRKCGSRRTEIEKELPRFVAFMANELKSERNVLELIDTYKANYKSPLTEELSITVSDMRTGNQEQALHNLETRINSPMLSELVRGLQSEIRGNDMTLYFENLGYKMADVWKERMKQQALKKEPKLNMMSLMLFLCSVTTVFIALGFAVYSAASRMGG
jgi:tight adherence protein C